MNIYQRGDRWYLRINVKGQDIRKSLGRDIKTRAQAEKFLKEVQKKRREGKLGILEPGRISLKEFRKQFIKEREGHISEKTITRYDVALRALENDLSPNLPLRNLTERKISQFASRRLSADVSKAGVNADLRHIKAALRKAQKWGLIEKAPDIEFIKIPKRLPRHIDPDIFETLLEKEKDPLRKRMWTFLGWTGMRRSEALNLQWQHIDLSDKPTARVIGKGDKERYVPLLPAAVNALGPKKDIGPVWPQDIHPDTWTHWFKALAKKCGADHRLHDLRHTCFTYLLSKGINIKVVQQIAGHTDMRTTQEYTKAFVGDLYDEMAKFLQ